MTKMRTFSPSHYLLDSMRMCSRGCGAIAAQLSQEANVREIFGVTNTWLVNVSFIFILSISIRFLNFTKFKSVAQISIPFISHPYRLTLLYYIEDCEDSVAVIATKIEIIKSIWNSNLAQCIQFLTNVPGEKYDSIFLLLPQIQVKQQSRLRFLALDGSFSEKRKNY